MDMFDMVVIGHQRKQDSLALALEGWRYGIGCWFILGTELGTNWEQNIREYRETGGM